MSRPLITQVYSLFKKKSPGQTENRELRHTTVLRPHLHCKAGECMCVHVQCCFLFQLPPENQLFTFTINYVIGLESKSLLHFSLI